MTWGWVNNYFWVNSPFKVLLQESNTCYRRALPRLIYLISNVSFHFGAGWWYIICSPRDAMHTDHLATLSSVRHRNAFRCAFYTQSPLSTCCYTTWWLDRGGCVCMCVCSCASLYNYTTAPQGGTADGERETARGSAWESLHSFIKWHKTFPFCLLHIVLGARARISN